MRRYFARIPVDRHVKDTWFDAYMLTVRLIVRRMFRVYFTETEMIRDQLAWFWQSPEVVGRMVDTSDSFMYGQRYILLGRLIRNEYGLWESQNPYTKIVDCETTDGIITDPLHPDAVSSRVTTEVMTSLRTVWNHQQEAKRNKVTAHAVGEALDGIN